MNDLIEISIIIPMYNAEKSIEYTLNSIKNQSFSNFEVIIVNDGSTDDSYNKCLNYKKSNNINLKIYSIKNSGVSVARNYGLEKSHGNYIIFVDSDDILYDKLIEKMYIGMKDKTVDLVACGFELIYNISELKSQKLKNEFEYFENVNRLTGLLLNDKFRGFLWNKIYKREILDRYNIRFDESISICEDLLFNVEYFSKCSKIAYLSENLYGYMQNISSSYNKMNNMKWFSIYEAYSKIIKNLELNKFDKKIYDEYLYDYLYICCEAIYKNKINTIKYSNIKIFYKKLEENYYRILLSKNINIIKKLKLIVFRRFPLFVGNIKMKKLKKE